jgi:hypothetical protein
MFYGNGAPNFGLCLTLFPEVPQEDVRGNGCQYISPNVKQENEAHGTTQKSVKNSLALLRYKSWIEVVVDHWFSPLE